MGVQRAKPIDLSAGNEPFHINGGRGDRTWARCLCLCVGVLSAAGFHMAALRFPSHCAQMKIISWLMLSIFLIDVY